MKTSELNSRINDLKEGDFLDLSRTCFGGAGLTIEYVTPKAIKVNGDWIPKSQIVDVDYGWKYKGIESNDTSTECKQIILNKWFDDKTAKTRWDNRGASGAY